MDKQRISLGLLLGMAAVATAKSITLPFLQRKGAIETLYVEPANPTPATDVTLHVTVADELEVDRIETQRIGNLFIITIHWNDPAGNHASVSGQCEKPLGTLAKGTYRLFVQSLYNGFLGGSTHLSFDVVDAGAGATVLDVIDGVSITPQNPTTSDTAVLSVCGQWPTAGYSQSVSILRLAGSDIMLDLYWNKPQGPVALVVTRFTYETPLKLRIAGAYTVHVRVYLDEQLVDSEAIPIEVAESAGAAWPWNFRWESFLR